MVAGMLQAPVADVERVELQHLRLAPLEADDAGTFDGAGGAGCEQEQDHRNRFHGTVMRYVPGELVASGPAGPRALERCFASLLLQSSRTARVVAAQEGRW
jgi:hypothetical protein